MNRLELIQRERVGSMSRHPTAKKPLKCQLVQLGSHGRSLGRGTPWSGRVIEHLAVAVSVYFFLLLEGLSEDLSYEPQFNDEFPLSV